MIKRIENLPLYRKNEMLIYQRHVLSKLSRNLSITDIDISWVKQSLDGMVNQYLRS